MCFLFSCFVSSVGEASCSNVRMPLITSFSSVLDPHCTSCSFILLSSGNGFSLIAQLLSFLHYHVFGSVVPISSFFSCPLSLSPLSYRSFISQASPQRNSVPFHSLRTNERFLSQCSPSMYHLSLSLFASLSSSSNEHEGIENYISYHTDKEAARDAPSRSTISISSCSFFVAFFLMSRLCHLRKYDVIHFPSSVVALSLIPSILSETHFNSLERSKERKRKMEK